MTKSLSIQLLYKKLKKKVVKIMTQTHTKLFCLWHWFFVCHDLVVHTAQCDTYTCLHANSSSRTHNSHIATSIANYCNTYLVECVCLYIYIIWTYDLIRLKKIKKIIWQLKFDVLNWINIIPLFVSTNNNNK